MTQDIGAQAERAASTTRDSTAWTVITVAGLITFGVVHLVVGWIAVQLAIGGRSSGADQQGALKELSSTPLGPVLLWAVAVGLFALVLWRIGQAVWGYGWIDDTKKKVAKRIGAAAQALIYLSLGIAAVRAALGGSAGDGDASKETLSARLLQTPFGVVLIIIVAAIIAAVGIASIIKGIRQKFTEDLTDNGTKGLNTLGSIGYVAKGLSLVIVGLLFAWSALTHDPNSAGGLDEAFRTVKQQPFGTIALIVMAAGFVCFGLFCFGWSRRARR